ncbi:MAG: hypothetical protein R3F11_28800 [Verrucomicrobiales bacterium]
MMIAKKSVEQQSMTAADWAVAPPTLRLRFGMGKIAASADAETVITVGFQAVPEWGI